MESDGRIRAYFIKPCYLSLEKPGAPDGWVQVELCYLAEGGANIVYRILPQKSHAAPTPPPPFHTTQLLRLRKNKPFLHSTLEQLTSHTNNIVPLFPPDTLLPLTLVHLDAPLLATLNAALPALERDGQRSPERHGDTLPPHTQETHGALIPDMSFPLPSPSPPTPPSAGLLLELKPKWLAQSPNAPRTSSRCRTCALRALRRARRLPGGSNGGGDFCPLVLALGDAEVLRGVLEGVLGPVGEGGREGRERMIGALCAPGVVDLGLLVADNEIVEALVRFFTAGGGRRLVGVLRDLQIGLDPDGVLALAESVRSFPLSLSQSDCLLIYLVSLRTSHPLTQRPQEREAGAGPPQSDDVA
ncbi:Inositol-pentakisphosphate 2-kinase [Elasticomyces elasticus]|nr:Inositol-pentakisphosphate 2-kinase [Elasticomyces elasticus]